MKVGLLSYVIGPLIPTNTETTEHKGLSCASLLQWIFWLRHRTPYIVDVLDVCHHQIGRLNVEEQVSVLLLVDIGQSSGISNISRQRTHQFPVMVVENNLETDKVDLVLCKLRTYCTYVLYINTAQLQKKCGTIT